MSSVIIRNKEAFESHRGEFSIDRDELKRFFAVYAASKYAGFFYTEYVESEATKITRYCDKCKAAFIDDDQGEDSSFVFIQNGTLYTMYLKDFPQILEIERNDE